MLKLFFLLLQLVNKLVEENRGGGSENSQRYSNSEMCVKVSLPVNDAVGKLLENWQRDKDYEFYLSDFFVVGAVDLQLKNSRENKGEDADVVVKPLPKQFRQCHRCRRFVEKLNEKLCQHCEKLVFKK